MTTLAATNIPLGAEAALGLFQASLEGRLAALLKLEDEQHVDPRWSRAAVELRAYCLRPAKRVRPLLVAVGYGLASGGLRHGVPDGVLDFGVGLELLHTFMLVHDDVADRAPTRRGGPSLHVMLGRGKPGEDLAVVLGDHLYARAVEVMMCTGLPGSMAASKYMMEICRHTAIGQFLDLDLARAPLSEVSLFQTLKVATLKTAKYGFVAPLVAGAMLGNGAPELLEALERVGRHVGLAYQLRDDLIGLVGDDTVAGKDGGGDYAEGKRTFPVIAGWTRADSAGRERIEALWQREDRHGAALAQAREQLRVSGGFAATQRLIDRLTRAARKSLETLPDAGGSRLVLDGLVARLATRAA